MSDNGNIAKFILTVQVGDEQADEVEKVMVQAAKAFNARLTRGDFEPAKGGYYRKLRSKRLHKQGRLA